MTEGPILFFDGVCNLCNGAIDFVMRRDRSRTIRFASLQGETARTVLPAELREGGLDSMVLWEGGERYVRSEAALRVMARIGGVPAAIAAIGRVVPRGLRDAVYRTIAANRYRWFGQRDTCRVPQPEERERLLP
ncbi:MAG: DCC1-like thiol-disulfide oxidoreductase family protein [Fimbriimonadaceae bacterium]|nr:DCC1-like thiol-disulfide oxidoreductase family protein [Fimbriimonadaceae bacterium]